MSGVREGDDQATQKQSGGACGSLAGVRRLKMIVKHVLGSFLEELGYQIEEPDDHIVLLKEGDRIVERFTPVVTIEELRDTAYADAERQLMAAVWVDCC